MCKLGERELTTLSRTLVTLMISKSVSVQQSRRVNFSALQQFVCICSGHACACNSVYTSRLTLSDRAYG